MIEGWTGQTHQIGIPLRLLGWKDKSFSFASFVNVTFKNIVTQLLDDRNEMSISVLLEIHLESKILFIPWCVDLLILIKMYLQSTHLLSILFNYIRQ